MNVFSYIGAKYRYIDKIIANIPFHKVFIEVFCGTASLFFNKQPAKISIINDLNSDITNFFEVLQNEKTKKELINKLILTPYSKEIFQKSKIIDLKNNKVEKAYNFFVASRMCFRGFVPSSEKTAKIKNILTSKSFDININKKNFEVFDAAVNNLASFAAKLKETYIYNDDFRKIFKKFDSENSFFYCDPPYDEKNFYKSKFEKKDHIDLADCAKNAKGKVMLSYYETDLIRKLYKDKKFRKIYFQAYCTISTKSKKNDMRKTKEQKC